MPTPGPRESILRRITGARVAANSRPTGSAELGGSWQLDTGAQPVRSSLLNAASMRAYHGLPAAPADENYNANIARRKVLRALRDLT